MPNSNSNNSDPQLNGHNANGHTVVGRPDYLHDVLHKERVGSGDTLPNSYAYDVATIEDIPFEQTQWAGLARVVAKHNKGEADDLHAGYELVRGMGRRLMDVRRREEELLRERTASAANHNRALDEKIEALNNTHAAAAAGSQAAVDAIEQPLSQAHREAAHRVSLAGGFYDPQSPDPACVLRQAPPSLESLAAEMKLPWTPDDEKARLPKVVIQLLTIGIGAFIGISLGIMCRFYAPDLISRKLPLAITFALVGVLIAYASGEAVKMCFKSVSERYWLGRPVSSWGPLLVFALLFSTAIVIIDSYVEQHGMMAMVNMENSMRALSNNAPRDNAGSGIYFLAGMILSLPYVVMNAWHGYLIGRHQACLNQLIAERDRRYATADAEARNQPDVQHALAAISRVHDFLRAKADIEQRIASSESSFQTELAQLEQQRLSEQADFDANAKQRIQDAVRNFQGAQHEWNEKLAKAKRHWAIPEPNASMPM